MKAIISTKHGSPEVLQLIECEKPTPNENEVLIKVHAATVTQGDVMLRKLHPLMYIPMSLFGVKRKMIPGHEFAGNIEAARRAATQYLAAYPNGSQRERMKALCGGRTPDEP